MTDSSFIPHPSSLVSERSFEEAIECALLQYGPDACAGFTSEVRETSPPYGDTPPGGYRRRKPEDYDRTLCLLRRDVVDFVLATQPKEWKKLEQHHGAAVREQFLKRLAAEIERRGALDVLRNGIKDSGCKFRLATSAPRAGSTRRHSGCTRRTSSPWCARFTTARRTLLLRPPGFGRQGRASTWCSS